MRQSGYPIPDDIRAGRPTVAVVDDDPNALAALRRVLSRRFVLTTYQDPFEALLALGTLQPDAVILDLRMPGIDGMRVLDRLSATPATAHVRMVVYSSHEDLLDQREQRSSGAGPRPNEGLPPLRSRWSVPATRQAWGDDGQPDRGAT